MGSRMPILHRVSSVLSKAFFEWILMLLLFIDAVYSFLVTRFARLCKLPAPCPFCSRLDHVLGNEQPCFYRELICKTHKWEISSLVVCHLHEKLAGARSMCEGCCEKANDEVETNEPVTDDNAFDSTQVDDDIMDSPCIRICSCCGQHFKQFSVNLSDRKVAELEPTEVVGSPKIYTDYSITGHVDEPLKPKDIYHQSDPHENSKVEIPCADDGKSPQPCEASAVEEDVPEDATFELPDIPFPDVVKESERNVQKELSVTNHHDKFLANHVVGDHSNSGIHGDQIKAKDLVSINWASHNDPVLVLEDSCVVDVDVSQCSQNPCETEPCQSRTEVKKVPYTSQFTILEQHYALSGERNIKDDLEQDLEPEFSATSSGEYHQSITSANDPGTTKMALQNTHLIASEDADLKDDVGDTHVSQGAHSENIGEVKGCTKKFEPTDDMVTHDMKMQSGTAPNNFIEKGLLITFFHPTQS